MSCTNSTIAKEQGSGIHADRFKSISRSDGVDSRTRDLSLANGHELSSKHNCDNDQTGLLSVIQQHVNSTELLQQENEKLQAAALAFQDELREQSEARRIAENKCKGAEKALEIASKTAHELSAGGIPALTTAERTSLDPSDEFDNTGFESDLDAEEQDLMQKFDNEVASLIILEKRKNRRLAATIVRDRELGEHFMEKSRHLAVLLDEKYNGRGDLEDLLKGKEEYTATLIYEMGTLESENRDLRKQLAQRNAYEVDTENQLQDLKTELYETVLRKNYYRDLNSANVELLEKRVSHNDLAKTVKNELGSTRAQSKPLDKQVERLTAGIDELSKTNSLSRRHSEDQKAEISELILKVTELEQQVSGLTVDLDAKNLSIELTEHTHAKTVREYENSIAEMTQTIEEVKDQLQEVGDTILNYASLDLSEQQRFQLESRDTDIAQARDEVRELKREIESLRGALDKQDEIIQRYRHYGAQHEENSVILDIRAHQRDERVAELEHEAVERRQQFEEQRAALVQQIQKLQDAVETAQNGLEAAQAESSRARNVDLVKILWLKQLTGELYQWLRQLEEYYQHEHGESLMINEDSTNLMAACDETLALLDTNFEADEEEEQRMVDIVERYKDD